MRSKRSFERAKLSPFLETAFGQLLAELPKTRAGYELAKRIEERVAERRKKIWVRKVRLSKGRKRSKKELEDRKVWFDSHVLGKTVYKAAAHLGEARDDATASQTAYSVPVARPAAAQMAYEATLAASREIGREKGESGWDD